VLIDYNHRLYGATNVQVYFYYRKYPKDRIILRCIVPFLWYVRSWDDEPTFLKNAIGRWTRFIWRSQSMSCGITLSSRSEMIKLSFLLLGTCHSRSSVLPSNITFTCADRSHKVSVSKARKVAISIRGVSYNNCSMHVPSFLFYKLYSRERFRSLSFLRSKRTSVVTVDKSMFLLFLVYILGVFGNVSA
jgi:hypothetical protein